MKVDWLNDTITFSKADIINILMIRAGEQLGVNLLAIELLTNNLSNDLEVSFSKNSKIEREWVNRSW
jgi:hypothetical protein